MSGRRDTDTALGARGAGRVDRREFICKATLVAGGIAVTAAMPWPGGRAAGEPLGSLLDDWTIDDQWGAYPRYADPIGFGRRAEGGRDALAAAEPLAAVFYG